MTAYDNNNNNNSERTEVFYGGDNTTDRLLQAFSNTKSTWNVCANSIGPSVSIGVEPIKKGMIDLKERGIRIRYATEITKENLSYCKELMKIAEVRHLDGIKGGMAVGEKEYVAAAVLQEAKPVPHLIYSNVKEIVEHQQYMFETLWSKSIPAQQKIREIDEGINLGMTEIIQDSYRTKEIFIDIIRSATDEILLILPTVNALLREERIGIIELLREAAEERNTQIRLLTPMNDLTEKTLQKLDQKKEGKKENIKIRRIELESEIKSTIVVVDRKASLITELRDDSKYDIVDAIGLANYSTSKPSVLSYISIFEMFWKQVELYEQLKSHDKMQKEFINIASHEMKTPTQAIIGYSELFQHHPEKSEQMIQAISRNAIRLQRLTNDILDVTRIESHTLNLDKEQFNLNDLITSVIEDYRSQIEKENGNVTLLYNKPKSNNLLIVEADRGRITQAISNLLSNAIKFSPREGGIVSITAKEENKDNDDDNNNNNQQVIVSVKDNGEGIHPEIFPRLFTKFATKSSKGTGLGLFITKNIIEAHGGTIWAENILDSERGATFTFSLPLSKKQQQQNQEQHQRKQYSNLKKSGNYQK